MNFDDNEPQIKAPDAKEMVIESDKAHMKDERKATPDHMKKNLNEIIEKAVKVRQEKILFDVDNCFILEGNL